MERIGHVQKVMSEAASRNVRPSILKHLLFVWGGGIVIWPTLIAMMSFPTLPSGEAVTLTFMTLLLNIFTGWIFALFTFVIHWGVRGGITMRRNFIFERDRARAAQAYQHMQAPPQAYAPVASSQVQADSVNMDQLAEQWKALNPYGCCMEHRDAAGYPSHGGPGCQHPGIA